ncbi:MAG: transposase, partial [Bacteroidales bacterium]|nr:transposase [Bacteroidales bacterium]
EHTLAEKLIASSTTLLQLRDFHIRFRNILKGNSSEDLYKWIEQYSKSPYGDVVSFVKSVQRDIAPIKNAIKYSISNGLIEGLNNKMKYIKRSMYGRASDRLLWIKIFQTCLT